MNVILVDFRGFDTMLEITVLGIASLGIFTMIKLRAEMLNPLAALRSARHKQGESAASNETSDTDTAKRGNDHAGQ